MAAPKTPLLPLNATLGCPRGVQGHPGSPWQGRGAGTEAAGGSSHTKKGWDEARMGGSQPPPHGFGGPWCPPWHKAEAKGCLARLEG